MVTNEYRFSDSKIIINLDNLPNIPVTKQIIAVWPPEYLDEIAKRSDKLFKYVSLSMYMNRTGNNYCDKYFYEGYVDFISSIECASEIDTPYILIDGYIDVIKALHDTKISYTLYTPFNAYPISKLYSLSDEQFDDIVNMLNSKSFKHIMSNVPVDLFIINNSGIIEDSIIGLLSDIPISDRKDLYNSKVGLYSIIMHLDKIN